MDAGLKDTAYVDSVVLGHRVHALEEEHSPKDREHPTARLLEAGRSLQTALPSSSWERSCWPHNCGAGGGPWKKRQTTLVGGLHGRWQEYVVIEYYFDPTVDAGRRSAFRKAVAAWGLETCIHFAETALPPEPPSLWVDMHDAAYCYVSHIGYPGDGTWATMNMGWCDSDRYVGNIIHELGHVLGMNHEQKRPDALHEFHGHGPFLRMHWNNVQDQWLDQYEPDPKSYVGSANDGMGDPFSGYAEYDFGSIMHYPAGNHFDTIPTDKAAITGNRRALSHGDILQILDQYQCKLREG
eukprot:SRR837773.4863.p1 GENE.SRR837773.4863~~SRR837773.4863.p1  ORF type:complete len:296 (-),score=16.29 SRR837773.4863:129-1016(-)